MILILIVNEKGIVELAVEEGTMKFGGRKVGTVESSKREPFYFSCIHTIAFVLVIHSYGLPKLLSVFYFHYSLQNTWKWKCNINEHLKKIYLIFVFVIIFHI